MDEQPRVHSHRRRVDAVTALMCVITIAAIVGAAWLRYGPRSERERPEPAEVSVGSVAPPLRLLDLKTSEPIVLAGLSDRVVWLVFWSASSPSGRAFLPELEAAWKPLRAHRRFVLVTAAVEGEDPAVVRAAVAASGVELPVYLAGPETRRQYHVQAADPPLHVVIDAGGQVVTMARHAGPATIDRIAKQVRRHLDELDPMGDTRFAEVTVSRAGRGGPKLSRSTVEIHPGCGPSGRDRLECLEVEDRRRSQPMIELPYTLIIEATDEPDLFVTPRPRSVGFSTSILMSAANRCTLANASRMCWTKLTGGQDSPLLLPIRWQPAPRWAADPAYRLAG
jgi:hypothetical protein